MTDTECLAQLDAHGWIFAKTMPDNPHEYTLRKQWSDDGAFAAVVEHIRSAGYPTRFKGRQYTQWDGGGHTHWTMGAPTEQTILINRTSTKSAAAAYDRIAPAYDTLFTDAGSLSENEAVIAALGDLSAKSVLDIGCGTGLLLDYVTPARYVGIDPSAGMLRIMASKHQGAVTQCATCAEFLQLAPERFDLAVALFGVGSYLTAADLHGLRDVADAVFVMGYRPGYTPLTYRRTNVYVGYRDLVLPSVEYMGNYWVWRGE